MPYAIETFDLIKCFKNKEKIVEVVKDINIKVKQGELLGIVGPNGAGKTTLIKLLSTLILPTQGHARIDGKDLIKDADLVRDSIGLIAEGERSFYWRLTGRKNLEFFGNLYNLSLSFINRRINEIAKLLELEDVIGLPFQNYSTGMKQKMAIARGLLPDPPILFIDELSRNLDLIMAETLRRFVRQRLVREQNKTIILATHSIEEAESICDKIAIMHKGKICGYGTIDELTENRRVNLKELFTGLTM